MKYIVSKNGGIKFAKIFYLKQSGKIFDSLHLSCWNFFTFLYPHTELKKEKKEKKYIYQTLATCSSSLAKFQEQLEERDRNSKSTYLDIKPSGEGEGEGEARKPLDCLRHGLK